MIAAVEDRVTSFRSLSVKAKQKIKPAAAFASAAGTYLGHSSSYEWDREAIRQYNAFKDIPYTAIRPIAVKIAGQVIHAGLSGREEFSEGIVTKRRRLRRKRFDSADIEPKEDHEVLDLIMEPNEYMTRWALLYCTVASICLTGRSYWWATRTGGKMELWYLPTHWVRPVHEESGPFAKFRVQPPGVTAGWDVPAKEIAYFPYPDPSNPLLSFSSLQAQARVVNTDDKIQEAQHASMSNVINPKVVLHAGRLEDIPGATGTQPRILLTPEQRKDLIEAIKLAYRGPSNFGEPIIVDGLIDQVTPFMQSPSELDFSQSSATTEQRIMRGFGVNPIVAGQIEGANRASAAVAHEGFYALVVNPLIELISEVLTVTFRRYFEPNLAVWIEPATVDDQDLTLRRVQLVAQNNAITIGELRRYAETGELNLPERDDDDQLINQPPPEEDAGFSQDPFGFDYYGGEDGTQDAFATGDAEATPFNYYQQYEQAGGDPFGKSKKQVTIQGIIKTMGRTNGTGR